MIEPPLYSGDITFSTTHDSVIVFREDAVGLFGGHRYHSVAKSLIDSGVFINSQSIACFAQGSANHPTTNKYGYWFSQGA